MRVNAKFHVSVLKNDNKIKFRQSLWKNKFIQIFKN